jgi:hypothetical protein
MDGFWQLGGHAALFKTDFFLKFLLQIADPLAGMPAQKMTIL